MSNRTNTASADKKGYHHGDLRTALMDAALDMLSEEGIEKLSLRGVAKRAGVSQAAPYHHFKNRDQLLEAVAAQGFAQLRESLMHHAKEDPGGDFMRGMGVGYVMFAVKNPSLFRLMQGSYFKDAQNAPLLQQTSTASFNALVDGIRGALPDADEDTILIKSAAAWSIVHGLATLMIDGRLCRLFDRPIDEEEIARQVTDQLTI